ncbi:hypothetical protein E1B28_006873 [Marasmius oreades]|uniref:Uncharacterized protein n=1 Tax=Marasmius oreades TaxID=181124 RepID=A0A9P7UVC4_9AGAR|nr:uncharacterized protein E1B28_006873 [Marasmius oreades]KAG7093184.1 hypothetical protein E1B28_006873 [Marasmius oreades]
MNFELLVWFYRTFFLYLVALSWSCVGFTLTLPPPPVFAGDVTNFQWNWNTSDFHQSISGIFVAYLVLLPNNFNFECPLRLDNPGVGIDTMLKLFESFATARNPTNDSETSGNLLFTPGDIGTHLICTYGDVSTKDDGNFSPGTQQDGSIDPSKLEAFLSSLVFLDQSSTFNVTAGTDPTTSTSSTSNAASPSPNTVNDGDRSHANDGHDNAPDIAPIVGGVVGGIALLCLVLFLFWLKIQRKLKQFHKGGSGSTFGTPRTTHLRPGDLASPVSLLPRYRRDDHDQALSTPAPIVDPTVSPPVAHEIENSPTAVAALSETLRSLGPPGGRGIRETNESRPQFTVRHADSGWRPANIPGPSYVDVPPDYDEAR